MRIFNKPFLKAPKKPLKPLTQSLTELLLTANGGPLKFKTFVSILRGRGLPVFLILLTLPFSLPISIPGLSIPFGIVIAFMGLRLSFGKNVYWPKWILKKEIPFNLLESMVYTSFKGIRWTKKFIRPRFVLLSQNTTIHRLHGLFVFTLGALLAIPLPIPFSNFTSAIPLILLGLGLLEDDGLLVILSYFFGLLNFLFWAGVIFYSHQGYKVLQS